MEKREVYVKVTQDELLLLDLFKNSKGISFNRYEDSSEVAKSFCEMLGEPEHYTDTHSNTGLQWYSTDVEMGDKRIVASAFIKEE